MSEVRALLLTDVVDSTRLAESLGDAAMADLWAAHDRVARDLLSACRGREIDKTDGMLLLFEAAADAVGYALAYHRALAALPVALEARAGLHVGPVILRENSAADVALGAKLLELDGIAKPTAARVMALAQGGQTLLTAEARTSLGQTACQLQSHGHWVLKGVAEPVELFELCDDGAPSAAPADADKAYRVVRVGERWLPVKQVPHNLPQRLTSFIGRGKEIEAVKQMLDRTRLLTLTGSGGCGKTRLALQVAAELLAAYPDGVWLAELAALADPDLVPQTVAMVFGLKEEPGKSLMQTLTGHLGDKQVLLVLDNAEHLLGACAQLADAVLRQCPRVVLLASSREGLGMAGELTYRVPSLALPDPKRDATLQALAQCEAIRLFVERAQSHSPRFAITRQNALSLVSICHRLDGIPFAIELAAARVRSLSVDEVNARLDERFRLLTGGSRTALPRQQTLRALIDWSYDQVNSAEQALLCRLSVFAGGWTLAAAEQVCSGAGFAAEEVLDLLTALADKSLVLAEDRKAATRYRLLETVRQYARDRLLERAESDPWRDRHLAYFLAVAEQAEPLLAGADQQAWLDRLETEHDNIRSALTWSCASAGDALAGLRLAAAIWRFWWMRGYQGEGRGWLTALLAAAPGEPAPAARAKALNGAGVMAWQLGDYPAARKLHDESLELWRELGDLTGIASALNNLANVTYSQGDFAAARPQFEEGLAVRRTLGDRKGIADSLNNLAGVAYEQGDYPAARALYEECAALRRELADRWGHAIALNNLGAVADAQVDYATARARYEESLATFRELGDKWGVPAALNNLGEVAYAQGDYQTAWRLYDESLQIRREVGERRGVVFQLTNLGKVASAQGKPELARALYEESLTILHDLGDQRGIVEALEGFAYFWFGQSRPGWGARLLGAAEHLREKIGCPLPPKDGSGLRREVAAARTAMGDDAVFDRAWQEGREMTLDQALAYALQKRQD